MAGVEIAAHPLGVDHQAVDQPREAVQGEVGEDAGVGQHHPLDRAVRDVALVPERHVLQGRDDRGTDHPGEPGQVLRQHRVALVRHGRAALLPDRERLLGLADLGALQVADLGREPLDRGREQRQGGGERGVAVARDHLGRDRLRAQPEPLGDRGLDPRVDVGEGADRPGHGAGHDLVAALDHAPPAAGELGEVAGELEAEGGGLGVDAVAAADGGRELVLEGAPLQRVQHRVDLDQDQVGCALELDRQRGVEQVGGGQPEMQEPCLLAADLLDMGEEGDDVVPGDGLDLLDPGGVDQPGAVGGDGGIRVRTGSAGTAPIAAMASAAASSTSSQMPSLVSGAKIAAISGRL